MGTRSKGKLKIIMVEQLTKKDKNGKQEKKKVLMVIRGKR